MPPPPRPGQTGDFVTITHRGDDARRGTGSLDRSIKQGGARPGDIDIMTRIILVFGSIAGILGMTLLAGSDGVGSEAIGYLGMLLSLSIIFVAIKRHRDINLGGVIRFWPALALGLGVAALAGVFYVVAWEIYFNATDRAFMEAYLSGQIAAREAAGATAAELAAFRDEMTAMMEMYGNWWFRLPMTFIEIFPIGVLVSLISAALLRNRKLLPHRA
jgi:hypothetical protein